MTFLQILPAQGYVDGGYWVIRSRLAATTFERGALVKVEKGTTWAWAWQMWAQELTADFKLGLAVCLCSYRKREEVGWPGGHHDKMVNNSNKALWVAGQGHKDEQRGDFYVAVDH